MTLTALLASESLRQHEFPVARRGAFLAHAAVSPLPRRVAGAIRDCALQSTEGDQEAGVALRFRETRTLAARLLGAQAEEIAFVGPTSLALSFVAGGLLFRKTDNVLIYFDDYPANVYPWLALAERGVEVRRLRVSEFGCLREADVLEQVGANTRLVALASCHFLAGHRPDLAGIGRALRQRNILFCVDAIQTLGAFPTSVEHVDFLAADAHKWLLGPCGAGLLYVRQAVQDQLRPIALGWHNVRCPSFVAAEEIVLRPDARRYEAGTHNVLGLVGLQAALELLLEVGLEEIAAVLLRHRARLVPALQAKGFTVLNANAPPEHASAIVTFFREGTEMPALHARLEAGGVTTSLRADRSGREYLRLSPHFYNTDEELRRAVELIGSPCAS